jgi:hypothetical protein
MNDRARAAPCDRKRTQFRRTGARGAALARAADRSCGRCKRRETWAARAPRTRRGVGLRLGQLGSVQLQCSCAVSCGAAGRPPHDGSSRIYTAKTAATTALRHRKRRGARGRREPRCVYGLQSLQPDALALLEVRYNRLAPQTPTLCWHVATPASADGSLSSININLLLSADHAPSKSATALHGAWRRPSGCIAKSKLLEVRELQWVGVGCSIVRHLYPYACAPCAHHYNMLTCVLK